MPSFPATIFSGAVSMIIAVQLQITIVSINTPSACVSPAFTGAHGAEPEPASFEKRPLFTPFMSTAPKPPAATCLIPKASSNILEKTDGIMPIFLIMIKMVMAK